MEKPERCEREDCGVPADLTADVGHTGDGLAVESLVCFKCGKRWIQHIDRPPFPTDNP